MYIYQFCVVTDLKCGRDLISTASELLPSPGLLVDLLIQALLKIAAYPSSQVPLSEDKCSVLQDGLRSLQILP